MTPFQAIVLGIVQGLTEFLPVSSSAHLALIPWAFGWQDPGLAFDVSLHLGTLLAVLWFFSDEWIRLARSAWSIVTTRRLDTPEKITGKAQFGIDVNFPDMRVAVVARPPAFGAKLGKFDPSAALKVPGVEKVVPTANGVAVVAKHFWAAKLGRDALHIDWTPPEGGSGPNYQSL